MSDEYDHAGLKELAKELDRPLYTLQVLSNDPFTAGSPARQAGAEWFARLWKKRVALGAPLKLHPHGFHYILVSQAKPVLMPDGKPYENTIECHKVLDRCSLDARYLELVSADDFLDHASLRRRSTTRRKSKIRRSASSAGSATSANSNTSCRNLKFRSLKSSRRSSCRMITAKCGSRRARRTNG
jgi:hypothetical protein